MKNLAFTALLVLLPVGIAEASFIQSITVGSNTAPSGTLKSPAFNGRLNSSSTDPYTNNERTEKPISVDVTAWKLFQPFDVTFVMNDATFLGNDDEIVGRAYRVTLTMRNDVDNNRPIGPIQVDLVGAGAGAGIRFLDGPVNVDNTSSNPPGDAFIGSAPDTYFGYVSDTRLVFGGLNGGGVHIPNGGSQDFAFSIFAPHTSSDFALRFTANPEPGTLALAGLALFPLGVAVRRRRRRAKK